MYLFKWSVVVTGSRVMLREITQTDERVTTTVENMLAEEGKKTAPLFEGQQSYGRQSELA